MKMKVQPNMSELFDQAIETFDSALRTGVRIQEEATRWWTDMLRETDTLQELQHRAQTMMMDALPTTQRNVDQYMKLLDKTYHTSLELLNKALQTTQSGSLTEAQQRIQEFWEATFTALRTNAQAMVQVNTRTMEAWAEMTRRDTSQTWESAREAAKAAAGAAADATSRAARPGARTSSRSR
jgi:hypothetical protein